MMTSVLITEKLRGHVAAELALLAPTPGEGGCGERGFPLLPREALGLSSPTAHPTINEQPEYPLNFNDITDAALLIAHLLIWNEF